MDPRWEKALAWHDALPMGRRKVEYNATIRRALAQLQDAESLESLQARYDAGVEWVTDIAREGFPDTPALWATERTADVAFGLRARQILGLPGAPPGLALALALLVPLAPRAAAQHTSALRLAAVGHRAKAATSLPCSPAQLRATLGRQTAGAGSIFTAVVLRNAGRQSCTLRGYPGVLLVESWRCQLGRAASWDPGVVRLVTLLPGGAASTLVHTLNPGIGTTRCLPPSAALRIYPPGGWTALYIPARLSECLGTLGVLPIVAGTNGSAV